MKSVFSWLSAFNGALCAWCAKLNYLKPIFLGGQGTVTELVEENGVVVGVEYKEKRAKGAPRGSAKTHTVYAPLTLVCDGHFSRFRGQVSETDAVHASAFVGIVLGPYQSFALCCDVCMRLRDAIE